MKFHFLNKELIFSNIVYSQIKLFYTYIKFKWSCHVFSIHLLQEHLYTHVITCTYSKVQNKFRGVKFKSSFVYQTYSKRHTCTLTMHSRLSEVCLNDKLHLIWVSVVNVGLYGRFDNVTTRYIYIHRYPKNPKMVIISYISIWDKFILFKTSDTTFLSRLSWWPR